MKLRYKFMIRRDINNLNKIPLNELSWEIINYALKRGFTRFNAIDDRYDKYKDYVIWNLNSGTSLSYISKLINQNNELLRDRDIKNKIIDVINLSTDNQRNIDIILELIKLTNDMDYIINYKNKDKMPDIKKQEFYELLVEKYEYDKLPEEFTKNNTILGKMYLDKDINNIELFLKNNNGYYNVDEILNIIIENSNNDKIFSSLINVLKNNKVTNEIWKKIISEVCDNFNKFYILYNNFEELNNSEIMNIVSSLINNKITINSDDLEDKNKLNLICRIILMSKKIFENSELILKIVEKLEKEGDEIPFTDNDLYIACEKTNYKLTKDSPNCLKRNIDLVIIGLKSNTISLKDLNINNFIDCPIEKVLEMVNLGLHNKDDEKTIDGYKKIISGKLTGEVKEYELKNDIKYLNFSTIDEAYYDYIITNIPENVCDIYLSNNDSPLLNDKISEWYNSIKLFDVDKINKFIEAIKRNNRDIKLNFIIGQEDEEVSTELLQKISDLDMIVFNSINQKNRINGLELLTLNKTLDLFVEDIKNSDLSPYERYVAVYDIVKSFKEYKDYPCNENQKTELYDQSRSIYLIMQNDYMVCVGYANLLHSLLKRVGINSVSYAWHEGEHRLNYIKIKDEKYGIDGIFKSDPTNDNYAINNPINTGYDNINLNIELEFETILDQFLNSGIEYINQLDESQKSELYKYIIELDSELKDLNDSNEAFKMFYQKYQGQNSKSISANKTISAIISVKEHIAGRKFTDDEIRRERNELIVDEFDSEIDSIDYSNDLINYKEELFKMKYLDFIKTPKSYKEHCFNEIIKQLSTQLNVRVSMDKDNISIIYINLSEEEIACLKQKFSGLGIKVATTKKADKLYLKAYLTEILNEETIGDILFEKIPEIQEMLSLNNNKEL